VTIPSRTETLVFDHPFRLKGLDRLLPAGSYEILTDEEMIKDLSFSCYRTVLPMIMVPGERPYASAKEMIETSALELSDAQRGDKVASRD
jgi:hypothetical protein